MTEKQKLFQELNDRMVKDLGIKDMEKENEIIIKECVDMLEKIHSSINYLNSGIKDNNKDVIKQCNKIDDIIEYLNELNK